MEQEALLDMEEIAPAIPPIAFEQDVYADSDFESDDDLPDEQEEMPIEFDGSRIDVDSIIALTARLAHVLATEADLLAEMKVKEIESMQKEKINLLEALEAQKKFIDRNPELLEELSDEECLELAQIIEIFQTVMRENYRRLLVAREVNRKVVQAITDVVKESGKRGFYDETGRHEESKSGFSMQVNQTI